MNSSPSKEPISPQVMRMSDRLIQWTHMTPDDLDAAIEHMPVALVPCGSLEWHGPHLGTGCDSLRGHALCTGVAERLDGGVVLPPIYITAPGFCNWRGSMFFTPALVKQVAAEMFRELEKCGFKTVLMLLAHAGPMQDESFGEPAEEYMKTSDMRIIVRSGPKTMPEVRLGGGHAQAEETAELLAAAPDAVKLDRYDPDATLIPKYEGCDPELYCRGLSDQHHESVRRFMGREHYEWQDDLAEVVTPEAAQVFFNETCDALADELREALG